MTTPTFLFAFCLLNTTFERSEDTHLTPLFFFFAYLPFHCAYQILYSSGIKGMSATGEHSTVTWGHGWKTDCSSLGSVFFLVDFFLLASLLLHSSILNQNMFSFNGKLTCNNLGADKGLVVI